MGVKSAHFQNCPVSKGPSSKTAPERKGSYQKRPTFMSYLKIIRFFYRHFDYKISFLFFIRMLLIITNFGNMNRERMPAIFFLQICGDISTCRPVFISYIKKSYIVDNGTHFVVRYYIDIENSFSNLYFAVSTKDRLSD